MTFQLLPRARRDLENIQAWMEADSPRAAESVGRRIFQAFELLATHPLIGHKSEHGATREWEVTGLPYIIPYRVKPDGIEILLVFHASRRRPKRWG